MWISFYWTIIKVRTHLRWGNAFNHTRGEWTFKIKDQRTSISSSKIAFPLSWTTSTLRKTNKRLWRDDESKRWGTP